MDNQHSWYANELTPNEKLAIDRGQIITKTIKTPTVSGQLIAIKGDPKFGHYNFVEIGDWINHYEYPSGDFIKGETYDEVTYDSNGNVLKRKITDKGKKDTDFYTNQIWTSDLQIFGSDTVFTQKISWFHKDTKITSAELTLAVLNYKDMLSDRLKTKIKVGAERKFDISGKLISETNYKFQDKIKYK